jgi:hypothetical protein
LRVYQGNKQREADMRDLRGEEGGWRSPAVRSLAVAGLVIAVALAALLLAPRRAR